MSLRPRSASARVPSARDPVHDRAVSVVTAAAARAGFPLARTTATMLRPQLGGATGAFVSVPDVREHEDLAKRVAALEAALGGSTTGFKSLQSTMNTHLQAYGELVARVGRTEIQIGQLNETVKQLTTELRSHERADLRFEQIINNVQSELDRISNRLARHERNESIHSHGDSRHEPEGFQENDQPTRFMGAGHFH